MATQITPYPNYLRACIKAAGYSNKEVAHEIGVSESTFYDWAAGVRPIPHKVRQKLAYLLGCSVEELIPGKVALDRDSRESLVPGVPDTLDHAENIINRAWEAWFASRPSVAARTVNKLLPGLEKTAYLPYLPSLHMLRAKELASRAHGVLGSVCVDALQYDTAFFHYMQAHRFAEEIHDEDLTVIYLCLVGEVLRQQNDRPGALSYMENARDKAANASNATRGHILQVLAYAYGDTGQEAAFERTISEATDLLACSGEGRDTTQKEFIPFEVYEIRGKVNRDLGKPMNAIPYLDLAGQSLTQSDSVPPRWHALLEISRAQAYCDAGDMSLGIDLAYKGFLKAFQCDSPHQMNRVRKLLRKLEHSPFRTHPRVQDLKNLLYEAYVQMENTDLSNGIILEAL